MTGTVIQVIMGGGRAKFLPSNSSGERLDNVNLVDVWLADKTSNGSTASYVTNRTELLAIDVNNTDYLIGKYCCCIRFLCSEVWLPLRNQDTQDLSVYIVTDFFFRFNNENDIFTPNQTQRDIYKNVGIDTTP